MSKRKVISVLLLDDSPDLVQIYKRQLENAGAFHVRTETDGRRARLVADRQLFDVVGIDAKLDYRGVQLGGLRLADELRPRYGANSILVISRFITQELLREYGGDYEFLDKNAIAHLPEKIRDMRKHQYAFVAMPFAEDMTHLYADHIKRGIKEAGFRCVRADEVPHNRQIPQVVFELVEKSKLVIFVADGANANAYYEAGFADAMRKEVIIIAKSSNDLKFDVAQRHTIFYGGRPSGLHRKLITKVSSLRLFHPLTV
jgi:CheY-like chemotaxis protein